VLQEFIELHRDELIRRCRAKVSRRSIPLPTDAEIDHGVPLFLAQLVAVLHSRTGLTDAIGRSAVLHGHDMLEHGFAVSQVVQGYGDVCQAITELAVETDTPIGADEFGTLNRCLDDAIAGAVGEFTCRPQGAGLVEESAGGSERLGFFAHELRNLTNTAIVAFEVLKTGDVGIGGNTGRVLHRSLMGLRSLIGRSLHEARLTQGVINRELFAVSPLIDEIALGAALEANAKGVTLVVRSTERDVFVNADRQVLGAAATNLVQNAVKFTHPQSMVTLRFAASAERVLIEVEDECGGLPEGDVADLFRPFTQRGADRSGVGLGLAFTRWAAEANDGQLVSRNIPGKGCIFGIELPRVSVPAGKAGQASSQKTSSR
jgi:signal transduction histidine kinase